jgi:hypothetical protein
LRRLAAPNLGQVGRIGIQKRPILIHDGAVG